MVLTEGWRDLGIDLKWGFIEALINTEIGEE